MTEVRRLRETERWLAWIRLVGVAFAAFQVAVGTDYPPNYERWAWITTAVFAVGTLVVFWLARRDWSRPGQLALGFSALAFDFAVVAALILIYSFDPGSPVREIIFLPLVEAALRAGKTSTVLLAIAIAPEKCTCEWVSAPH